MPLCAGFAALLELRSAVSTGAPLGDAALFGAFVGLALALVAGLATFGELWIESVPVVGPDRILAASAVVFMVSAIALYVGIGQAAAALAGVHGGSPLVGLSVALHGTGPMSLTVAWLREPSALCALAAPVGALSAVRGDDEEGTRPWRREAPAVAALSCGVALLTGLVFFLIGAPTSFAQGFTLEGTALRLVVPPVLGVALSTAACLGEVFEVRVHRWLESGNES